MRKLKNYTPQNHYIVVNPYGEAYIGMIGGIFQYSPDWDKAKPLELPSTKYLMRVKGNELLEL